MSVACSLGEMDLDGLGVDDDIFAFFAKSSTAEKSVNRINQRFNRHTTPSMHHAQQLFSPLTTPYITHLFIRAVHRFDRRCYRGIGL